MEDISPLAIAIVVCEIGFWVVLAAGLAARYLLRWRRTSVVLLVSTPLLDVALLAFTVADLRDGGEATGVHGLGAAYLGFSVAFGHSLIRWADQRVAHRFAGGPPPVKPPKRGPAKVRHEWREWGRCVLAAVIACSVMALLSFVVASPAQTEALWGVGGWMTRLGLVTGVWFVAGPVWTSLSNMKPRGLPRGDAVRSASSARWFTEAVGIVLCIQGVGGGLSALLDGGPSWFLVRYVVPDGAQVAVGAVIALAGVLVLAAGARKRQDA